MMDRFTPISAPSGFQQLSNGTNLHYFCWNPEHHDKPVALLQHGTGFVAASFNRIARQMCHRFQVYAYDRRGHGLSSKPAGSFQLLDFADDCIQFCHSMGWRAIYGIGHSAGATDLLIAESLCPGLFNKLFVLEPTINDPDAEPVPLPAASGNLQSRIDQARKRRAIFPSRQAVWDSYRQKPLFASWQVDALAAYLYYGFAEQSDGTVMLQCHPDIEAQILSDILATFANVETGSSGNMPFNKLKNVRCPIAISHSELSAPQFRELSRRARKHFPNAETVYFEGLGHCVP